MSLLVILIVFSCTDPIDTPEYKVLKAENDSLKNVTGENDETIISYIQSFNEIQENLEKIKEKEKIISISTAEGDIEKKQEIKDKINDDIKAIYELLQYNKQTIKDLERKLRNSDMKVGELEKMLVRLTQQIEEKDMAIEQLKTELEKLDIIIEDLTLTVDTLAVANEEKDKIIEDQTTALNTAYYVYGTSKELKEREIITREGGFIGIGKMDKLLEDFEKDYFTKIDITETTSIDLYGKKINIVTTHPTGSYKTKGEDDKVDKLVITDPEAFWSVSKYLVIVVN